MSCVPIILKRICDFEIDLYRDRDDQWQER